MYHTTAAAAGISILPALVLSSPFSPTLHDIKDARQTITSPPPSFPDEMILLEPQHKIAQEHLAIHSLLPKKSRSCFAFDVLSKYVARALGLGKIIK